MSTGILHLKLRFLGFVAAARADIGAPAGVKRFANDEDGGFGT